MSIVPLGNNIVAQRATEEEVTAGGIILPDSVVKDQDEAVVISVPQAFLSTHPLRGNGQKVRIIIEKHCGQKVVDDDGTEYVVVHEDDIVAIISDY